ncbi:MAG TPA: geranylgeranylglycerol-phosphate geranylgeranyltransferase [Bacteroidales bacterium]|nr:geranylgeranylglycerol-phosphate geranylgeranyltransferase [Bacteroidales bacterium]
MLSFLKLIRIQQLLIIAACMYSVRYFLIEPLLMYFGYELNLPDTEFALLTVSVLLITAGASIINDYFDRKADLHNNPEHVLVGISIDRRMAIILHSVFSVLGIAAGWWVAYKAGFFWFGLIFPFITFVFWRYSALYKRQLFLGNVIISLLVAGIPFLVFMFEYFFAVKTLGKGLPVHIFHHLMVIHFGISTSAFLLNMVLEIVKDIRDFRGDYQAGAQTLPIRFGKRSARTVSSLLLISFVTLLVFAWFLYLRSLCWMEFETLSMMYILIFIVLPSAFLALRVFNMKKKKQLNQFANGIKFIMLMGFLFTIIIYLNIHL